MNATEAKQLVLDFFAELTAGEERAWDRVADDATWQLMARARDYPYATEYTKGRCPADVCAAGAPENNSST